MCTVVARAIWCTAVRRTYSLVPSMMITMSHLFSDNVLNELRFQYGESPCGDFCIVEPDSPMFVTQYLPLVLV